MSMRAESKQKADVANFGNAGLHLTWTAQDLSLIDSYAANHRRFSSTVRQVPDLISLPIGTPSVPHDTRLRDFAEITIAVVAITSPLSADLDPDLWIGRASNRSRLNIGPRTHKAD